jgi:hypothetical protein
VVKAEARKSKEALGKAFRRAVWIRDHGRCPLWLWWQIQLDDGFLGVWHWELPNGALVYRDGCWAGADMSEPVPVVDFSYDAKWVGADGKPTAYGEHGDAVAGVVASAAFTLADRRVLEVEAAGSVARTYEPFPRGGLNLMRYARATDARAPPSMRSPAPATTTSSPTPWSRDPVSEGQPLVRLEPKENP